MKTEAKTVQYFQPLDPMAPYHLSVKLCKLLEEKWNPSMDLVVLCIGTDRVTGDSLGPLIGYKLSKILHPSFYIYGTLENPVHALNLSDTIQTIKKEHPCSCIIAIDASLGVKEHLGCVMLKNGPIQPGAGVRKKLELVGDVSITGIVNSCGILDHLALQTTRLSTVMNLADCISQCLQMAHYRRFIRCEREMVLPKIPRV